jgi:molybdopterin-guanine dinucleotide biosynthesis protein A
VALAGGASRRLGGAPKGLEVVGGRRIVDSVVATLRAACEHVVLAANDSGAAQWIPGLQVVRDRHPGTGGLAGVDAALQGAISGVIVVAWDMPFVTPELLRALVGAARIHRADLVIPESDSPYGFEPFCAYYGRELALGLGTFLERGGGAARDFVRQVGRVHRIPLAEVAKLGDPQRLFFSVNTPDDLERARAMAESRG